MEFVVVTLMDGEECTSIWDVWKLIEYMDMSDCFSYDDIRVYSVSIAHGVREITLHYAWSNMNDPLYLCGTYENGEIAFSGYGTDH